MVHIGTASTAIDYAPFFIAKNKGWIEDVLMMEGLHPEYTTFQSVPPVNEALAAGRVDFVFAADAPAIVGRAAGIDVRAIALSCSLAQEILVRSGSAIKTVKDLKGKRVAVLAGSSSHYGLLKTVTDVGLEGEDVKVVSMIPPDAKAAFDSGALDVWAVWPPFVEQEELSGKGRTLPKGEAEIHILLLVRGAFADRNPKVVKDVTRVIQRAKSWMQANEREAIEVVSREMKIAEKVVKLAWPRHHWNAKFDSKVIEDLQAKADFLKDKGFIRESVDVSDGLLKQFVR